MNTQYAELQNSDDTSGANGTATPQTPPSASQNKEEGLRVQSWIFSAPVALVSTRYLLVDRQYHYPAHLLVQQLLVATCMILWMLRRHLSSCNCCPSFKALRSRAPTSWKIWLLPTVAAAFALPLFVQAILHLQNLATLVMLLPVITLVEQALGQTILRGPHDKPQIATLAILTFCCIVILADDYRLSVNGLVYCLLAMILFGLGRAAFKNSQRSNPQHSLHLTERLVIGSVFVILALFFASLWAIEPKRGYHPFQISGYVALILNLVATGLTLSHISLFFPILPKEPVEEEEAGQKTECQPAYLGSVQKQMYITQLVLFSSSLWTMRGFNSVWQISAYFGAVACTAVLDRTGGLSSSNSNSQQEDSPVSLSLSHGNWRRDSLDKKVVLSMSAWVAFLVFNFGPYRSIFAGSFSTPHEAILDTSFTPPKQLEIIISMYTESPSSVRQVISTLRRIPSIAAQNTTITIYTKDEQSTHPSALANMQEATTADQVFTLPNRGRESATYLHHIVHNWDSLAAHTIFIQADVHNPREFFPRLADYFVPRTGFLSLGFVGNVCQDCSRCTDRFGWTDESGILQAVYVGAHQGREECGTNPVLLSYKGQFVVSASRIRGVAKELYEELLDDLTNEESWTHEEEYLKGRKDSLSAPVFGYTTERLWNLLFQCNDMEIAWKCPTLLSGKRRGGGVEDCQCLDQI